MQWFADPPCTSLRIESDDPKRLELVGPGTGARLAGGAFAAVGGGIAAQALRMASIVPGPFKLIPAAVAVGAGAFGATGAVTAFAQASVVVERKKGVTFRWHARPLKAHERFVASEEIADFEVVSFARHDSENNSTEVRYRLVLVTRQGEAIPFEEFLTRTQANLRLDHVARTLGRKR